MIWPTEEAAFPMGGRPPGGQPASQQYRHQGGHQNVDLSFLGYRFTCFRSQDGNDQYRQRSSRSPLGIGGKAHRNQGKEHQRRTVKGIADGHRHGRAAHLGGISPYLIEKRQSQLGAGCIENGTDEQRAKKSLGHRSHGFHPIAPGGNDNILPVQK